MRPLIVVLLLAGCAAEPPDEASPAVLTVSEDFGDVDRAAIVWAWEEWERSGAPMRSVRFDVLEDDAPETTFGRGRRGWARMRQGFPTPAHLALHELGHALGIAFHHDHPGIMRDHFDGPPCVSSVDLLAFGIEGSGTCGR